jgi:catechol 2,3-dioxygenase-like lactoylglutathione lyase family enzyme
VSNIRQAIPVLFVSDVDASAVFFRDKLGFAVDFLHGEPPFYGSVTRDGATLHLRWLHRPALDPALRLEEQLLSAFLPVTGLAALFAQYQAAGVPFVHELREEAWGGTTFTVLDPDGNWLCFSAVED